MRNLLMNLKPDIVNLIGKISKIADDYGYRVYLVGGFVRDILLKRENLDVDIVVEKNGIEFSLGLVKHLGGDILTHKHFGTAVITFKDGRKIDIATARNEIYAQPAVLPKVSFGTIEDDLKRRDFTINALAVSINKNDFGRFIDLFNAQYDIKKGCIKILHKKSFIDDPTRIIRGIRFEQRFGFSFSKESLLLISQAKRLKMLERVQKHRLRDELILVLKEENPQKVIERLSSIYGLSFIHKKLVFNKSLRLLFEKTKREINWFKSNFPSKRPLDEWLVYLMVMVKNFPQGEIKKFCFDFAFRKPDSRRLASYIKELKSLQKFLDKDNLRPSEIHHILEPLSYEVIIAVLSVIKKERIIKHIHNFFSVYNGIHLAISGHDLKNIGIKPGPHFKAILKKTLHAKLDKKFSHKEEELMFVKKHYGEY